MLKIPKFRTMNGELKENHFGKILATDSVDEIIEGLKPGGELRKRLLCGPGNQINELYIGPGNLCGEDKDFVVYSRYTTGHLE